MPQGAQKGQTSHPPTLARQDAPFPSKAAVRSATRQLLPGGTLVSKRSENVAGGTVLAPCFKVLHE